MAFTRAETIALLNDMWQHAEAATRGAREAEFANHLEKRKEWEQLAQLGYLRVIAFGVLIRETTSIPERTE